MNISAKAIEECDGSAKEDRPERANNLYLEIRVGFREGSPILGERTPLMGEENAAYDNYLRGDELFQPGADKFLRRLLKSDYINDIEDICNELQTDRGVVRSAFELHNLQIPEGEPWSDNVDLLELPSGEEWPLDLLATPVESDVRVLSQLLATDGLSVEETAEYLSDRLRKNVTGHRVRRYALEHNILD